jgi:Fur family ferric uptake transcriptional regulator
MRFSIEQIKAKLREKGLKSTLTRIAVYQSILSAKKPVSHSDLVQELGAKFGDQATIYRNLVAFADKGLVRLASTAGGIARYELVREGETSQHIHPHFVCNDCGEVSCLPKTTVITEIDEQWQGILKQSQLQFVGQCLDCQPNP